MKILCLDIGTKRIGVALSDPLCITAQGMTTLLREKDDALIHTVRDIILSEGVNEIVIGLPLNMDGSEGPQAKESIRIAELFKKELDIPVKLWDERLTTMEAEKLMIAGDMSRKKRKKKIDKIAAQIILQGYLNSVNRP